MSSVLYDQIESDDESQSHRRWRVRSKLWNARRRVTEFYQQLPLIWPLLFLGLLASGTIWMWFPSKNRIETIKGPLTKEEVGHMTWSLLHSMAGQVPQNISTEEQDDYVNLLHILSRRYPCKECAQHFQKLLKASPPDVSTGDSYRQWLCNAHNRVRKRLDQPIFDCKRLHVEWQPKLRLEGECACNPTV